MEMVKEHEYATLASTNRARSSSVTVGIVGLGAVALAIIGLAKIYPDFLASIAAIVIGLALAFEGGAISARYAVLIREGLQIDESIRVGGVTSLFLAGAAGIALGILALVGIYPAILIPVSAVVFGGALVLDSGTNERLSVLEVRHRSGEANAVAESIVQEAAQSSAGLQILAGAGSVVLGILGLMNIVPIVLGLVAFLGIGAVNLLSSPMISNRMSSLVGAR